MPRKTVDRPLEGAAAEDASMRPRPDAAENQGTELENVAELALLQ